MKPNFARTACAALSLALASAASAATPASPPHPAIATGLAIPVDLGPSRLAEVPDSGRSVLVDAASARLFMIENGEIVDSMRVIVGKPSAATPTMKSLLYAATLNPYWNVPVDLAQKIIAPRVLEDGESYLRERGYEVVSGFREDAEVLSPDSVDWAAVAAGRSQVFVRQRPGPANSMGEMKFGFPNNDGIFLHDTPRKELFEEAERNISNGCVRLEDAPRLARWLLGRDPALTSDDPEQRLALPHPVPIIITYLDEDQPLQVAALR